jgi:uncharacterized membrane protein
MIEIIPNWHPVFVHFTVALLSVAVLLHLASRFVHNEKLRSQWETVAQWNLWLGAAITVLTVAMGVIAYNTVAHDTPSHEAMTEHRNWALVTASLFIALAIWSALRARAGQGINNLILIGLLVGGGLLLSTAWHGGEVVYRYGLGVMSLPKADAHKHTAGEHHHVHDESHVHPDEDQAQVDDVNNCELPEEAQQATPGAHEHEHETAHEHTPGSTSTSDSLTADQHSHGEDSHEGHSH